MSEEFKLGGEITDAEIVEQLRAELGETRSELERSRNKAAEAVKKAAVACAEANNRTRQAEYLEKQLNTERQAFGEAVRKYKRKRLLALKVPVLAMVVLAAIALATMAATENALVVPVLGELLTVASMVGCSFFCGLVYERVRK